MPITYSVIIPTLNQCSKLKLCLAHLSNLKFAPDAFEVLVIDNGSTDETKLVTESYTGMIKNLVYLYCSEPGLMAARHMGCDNATGDILCYLDDDSLVNPLWLQGMAESFSRDDVVIAGGPCIPKYEAPPPSWIEYFWNQTPFGRTNGYLSLLDFGDEFKMIPPVYIYGCNFGIRKKVFVETGGTYPDYFPDRYSAYQGNGETGLSFQLQKKGVLAVYNPRAKIEHLIPSSRLTLEYFCKRRFFNGIGASFQDVRKLHGLDGHSISGSIEVTLKRVRPHIMRIKCYVLKLLKKTGFIHTNTASYPDEVAMMKSKIEESFRAGYAFHQKSLKKDPKLLGWVLRPDYLGDNGKLPR